MKKRFGNDFSSPPPKQTYGYLLRYTGKRGVPTGFKARFRDLEHNDEVRLTAGLQDSLSHPATGSQSTEYVTAGNVLVVDKSNELLGL